MSCTVLLSCERGFAVGTFRFSLRRVLGSCVSKIRAGPGGCISTRLEKEQVKFPSRIANGLMSKTFLTRLTLLSSSSCRRCLPGLDSRSLWRPLGAETLLPPLPADQCGMPRSVLGDWPASCLPSCPAGSRTPLAICPRAAWVRAIFPRVKSACSLWLGCGRAPTLSASQRDLVLPQAQSWAVSMCSVCCWTTCQYSKES